MLETGQSNGGVVQSNSGVVYFGDQSVKLLCGLFWRPVSQTVVWSMLETSQSNGGVVYVGDQSVNPWCGLFWRPVSQTVVWSVLETG